MQNYLTRIGSILHKPPGVILQRLRLELNVHVDRVRGPRRVSAFGVPELLEATGAASLPQLWGRLSDRPYGIAVQAISESDYHLISPGDRMRILNAAASAAAHHVDLLGSGPVDLGPSIDWHTDFKTGHTWPPGFAHDIEYANLLLPSDVKVPWELSRLQWLIPAGQAYLLSGDEQYASEVRAVLEDWIESNPCGHSINWTCTMEVAMRLLSWTWFFHVFSRTTAWSDPAFQSRFLRSLYLHGEFTERYLEQSDINGNHFTADAAGLVFAGLFFGDGVAPSRWTEAGWRHLSQELPRQVFNDGVDFEASIAYHRLVLELFFLPAIYREACGLAVSLEYRDRLTAMARFTNSYTGPDGRSPLVGDADDARALPFGGQAIADHRYLTGLVGAQWQIRELMQTFSGPRAEILWTLGPDAAGSLRAVGTGSPAPGRSIFQDGGFYVMRNARDHVFIDCGPVGQAGRGGHGHNDCLSFEAVLDGVRLVSDCGAFVYTANAQERNRFRSTAYHNTPQIDGEEINRFISWDHLWTLRDDAHPRVMRWDAGPSQDVFSGTHSGYQRLASPVSPTRTMILDHERHSLSITDNIAGAGSHLVTIPLHLAPGVEARNEGAGRLVLAVNGREFLVTWSSAQQWELTIGAGRVSPGYGVVVGVARILWRRSGRLPATLHVTITPCITPPTVPVDTVIEALAIHV